MFSFFILSFVSVYSDTIYQSFDNGEITYELNNTMGIYDYGYNYGSDGVYYINNKTGLSDYSGILLNGYNFKIIVSEVKPAYMINSTNNSVYFASAGSVVSSLYSYFIMDLGYNIRLYNYSTISYYSFDNSGATLGESDFCFLNDNYEFLGCYNIGSANIAPPQPYCYNSTYTTANNINKKVNINIYNVSFSCPSQNAWLYNLTDKNIRYIVYRITSSGAIASTMRISNFTLSNVNIYDVANNSLPNISVIYNNSPCTLR